MIYDIFTLGESDNYVSFNDESQTDYYIRASRRQASNREIRQFDSNVPDEMGVVDYQTLVGRSYYIIEGKIYPGNGLETPYKGMAALRKVCNPKIAQDSAYSDGGYINLKWTEDGTKQLKVKPLYVDIPETTKKANTPQFKILCKVRYPFIEAQTASSVTLTSVVTAGTGLVIDSSTAISEEYGIENYSSSSPLFGSSNYLGQSFQNGSETTVESVKLYLKKKGSPTGNIYAKIYASTGTLGSSSKPTGSALATSDAIDITTITTSMSLYEFVFSGANRIVLSESTNYVVTVGIAGGTISDRLEVGLDGATPTHQGNSSYSGDEISWGADASSDLIFYLYSSFTSLVIPEGGVVIGADTGGASGSLTNNGDYKAYPNIIFTGPINIPRLTNTTTGKYIEFNYNLTSGTISVTIDYDGVTAVGSDGTNLLQYLTSGSSIDDFAIEPGTNAFTLTATTLGSGSSCQISARDTFPLS